MTDTPDADNYFTVTKLPDGSLHVQARADDGEGTVGHINRYIAPGDADYDRFAAHAGGDTPT